MADKRTTRKADCPHTDFESSVRVSDVLGPDGQLTGYEVRLFVRCAACHAPLRSALAPWNPLIHQDVGTTEHGSVVWLTMQMLPPEEPQEPETWAAVERVTHEEGAQA